MSCCNQNCCQGRKCEEKKPLAAGLIVFFIALYSCIAIFFIWSNAKNPCQIAEHSPDISTAQKQACRGNQ